LTAIKLNRKNATKKSPNPPRMKSPPPNANPSENTGLKIAPTVTNIHTAMTFS
jgi:hypothetical protein